MSKDGVRTGVSEYEDSADIGFIEYGDMSVVVSKTEDGKFIVNLERITDNRVDVQVLQEGQPLWEGNLM